MPRMSERERLADLVARQQRLGDEIEAARQRLRDRYARITAEMPVEEMSEREFREVLREVLRLGSGAVLAALKPLSPAC